MSQTTQSWWFVFYKDQLLLEKKGNGTFALPCGEIPPIVIKKKQPYTISLRWKEEIASLSPSPLLSKNRRNMQ